MRGPSTGYYFYHFRAFVCCCCVLALSRVGGGLGKYDEILISSKIYSSLVRDPALALSLPKDGDAAAL